MSKLFWQDSLRQMTSRLKKDKSPLRLVLLGIGNEYCGDDAAGILLVRILEPQQSQNPNCLVLEAGTTPENFTGALRKFSPDLVLIIDIAQFGGTPGEIRWINLSEIGGLSASTHTLPLNIFTRYLTEELGCEVAILGIEPLATGYGMPVSSFVKDAVTSLGDYLNEIINDCSDSLNPLMPCTGLEIENIKMRSSHYLQG